MTLGARWQPFQNAGEDDPRSPQDEMDRLRSTLARTLDRDGGQQIAATTSAVWTVALRPPHLQP